MDDLKTEVDRMAGDMVMAHGAGTASIACLVHLTRTFFRQAAVANGISLEPLITLQWDCLHHWMSACGVDGAEVLQAITTLERAGTTFNYLAAIPS